MIAAVVVTYSTPAEVLDRCLASVIGGGGVDRIVVVDTGGEARLSPAVAGEVDLVTMENRGYGAAANHGVELACAADAEHVVLLNDDVVVRPGWIEPLVAAVAEHGVGAAQPMLVDDERDVVGSLGVRLDGYGAGSDIGDGDPVPTDTSASEIEIFTGGAVLFDAGFFCETGGFDERYFLYYDDVDLSLRGGARGWTYRVVPSSVVEHRRGTSTGDLPDRTLFLQERNRLWTAFRFADLATIARAIWLSVRRLRHQPRRVHARGLAAGLAGAPTRLLERRRPHSIAGLRGPGRRTARR